MVGFVFQRGALVLIVVLLVCSIGCRSIQPPTQPDEKLGQQIDAAVGQHVADAEGPGIAAMVIRAGVVVHAKGYGIADLESKRPITRTVPFRLASVTKQFTCMAIMKLAEEGRLSIDDAAVDYLPTLARFGRGVTIRHLMHHTSGLPEYYAELERLQYQLPSADDDPLLTAVDASKVYESWGEPLFEPGVRFAYSNPGYEQLALIVEAVTGQSFGRYLRDAVLRPSGMLTATVRDRPEVTIAHRAVGYAPGEQGKFVENDDHPGNWIVGAGGLYASLDDLYFWDRALAHNSIVSHEMLNSAYTTATLTNGDATGYGYGWAVDEHNGHRRVSHGGAWVGFRTHISRYLDDDVTIVVLSNFASVRVGQVSNAIADLVL